MPTFELKSQLPKATQNELERVNAISSDRRTATEAAFLASRSQYVNNRVLRYDTAGYVTPQNPNPQLSTDLILEAEGDTLPTGYSGFKLGAFFRLTSKTSGRNLYVNVGSSSSASWQLPNDTVVSSQSPSSSTSPSASKSPSASVSPSHSASASKSPSASLSRSASKSTSPSSSKSPSASVSPSASGSPSSSVSVSQSPSASGSPSASMSPSGSTSPSSSQSPSESPSPSFPEV